MALVGLYSKKRLKMCTACETSNTNATHTHRV